VCGVFITGRVVAAKWRSQWEGESDRMGREGVQQEWKGVGMWVRVRVRVRVPSVAVSFPRVYVAVVSRICRS